MHEQSTSNASALGLGIAVVTSAWHDSITSALRQGAQAAFEQASGDPDMLVHLRAPGAWELPVLAAAVLKRPDIDGVVALGCVIKGETTHDAWINTGVAGALADLALKSGKPVGLGVLTCDTMAQAQVRAGGDKGNKGFDAMQAVIDTIRSLEQCAAPTEAT